MKVSVALPIVALVALHTMAWAAHVMPVLVALVIPGWVVAIVAQVFASSLSGVRWQ